MMRKRPGLFVLKCAKLMRCMTSPIIDIMTLNNQPKSYKGLRYANIQIVLTENDRRCIIMCDIDVSLLSINMRLCFNYLYKVHYIILNGEYKLAGYDIRISSECSEPIKLIVSYLENIHNMSNEANINLIHTRLKYINTVVLNGMKRSDTVVAVTYYKCIVNTILTKEECNIIQYS